MLKHCGGLNVLARETHLKQLYTIGKMSTNASILYKNDEEICYTDQPVKVSAYSVVVSKTNAK